MTQIRNSALGGREQQFAVCLEEALQQAVIPGWDVVVVKARAAMKMTSAGPG